ncbi:MAG: pirin family protein [Maribacter sp.]|nr:pirin family protein [Maribacter sp.]
MKIVLHKAETRGNANHGWLKSHHSFSFANYQNPERMNFGVLRVLNDDVVSEARGFGTHPHRNMEIISIPLEGDLQHMDTIGNSTVIRQGDVQVMSAGTGIQHSEYNKNKDRPVKFLQIWILPNKVDVEPRYDQISLRDIEKKNALYQIVSPDPEDQGVWIHQDAWFHLGDFESGIKTTYSLKKKGNGVYVFVLEGEVEANRQRLTKRDGFGIWDVTQFDTISVGPSKVLFMEVPMQL